jgi:hypothetical protein
MRLMRIGPGNRRVVPYIGGAETPHGRRLHPMRTLMAIAVTGAVAVWLANPALAAKVVTKYGTYEGGCQSASCLYKPMKKTHKVTKTQ